MRETLILLIATLLAPMSVGCHRPTAREAYGKTYYLDGSGNWGWGTSSVVRGLPEGGYQGDVEVFLWTTSFIPAIDHINLIGGKMRATALARKIENYRKRFPENDVNIVAFSAGTGVATWAVERLRGDARIHNLILLGCSLSHDYDMTRVLSHMTGRIYAYHSPRDRLLASITAMLGTVDGKRGVKPAGIIGLAQPAGMEDRVVNTPWSRRWIDYGWTGGHLSYASLDFVRHEISRHVIAKRTPEVPDAGRGDASPATYVADPP